MYSELYEAWQRETENPALQPLPADFYARVSDYLRRIKEETRMLDKKTLKAVLLERELQNVKRIVKDLTKIRYRKLIKLANDSQKPTSDMLTAEETHLVEGFRPFTEAYRAFVKSLLQGQTPKTDVEKPHNRVALRFVKAVPAIIGGDMKTYGPFNPEDVASVPVENAKILIKQGFAVAVDVS